MTTMEVMPSMTTIEVLSAFRYLVDAELRKRAGGDSITFRDGCQEGYIASIIDRYGTSTEEELERAYRHKETWLHVVQQIVENHLNDWADKFENLSDMHDIDFDAFHESIRLAVAGFALKNPKKLHNALKYL